MNRLENKVALITGGSRGMGATHVKLFISEGAKVYFTDVLEEDGYKLAKELGEQAVFLKDNVAVGRDHEQIRANSVPMTINECIVRPGARFHAFL